MDPVTNIPQGIDPTLTAILALAGVVLGFLGNFFKGRFDTIKDKAVIDREYLKKEVNKLQKELDEAEQKLEKCQEQLQSILLAAMWPHSKNPPK